MAQDFGNGVSRTLSALQRQFQTVVWQASKPPLDSELNLMSQMEMNRMAEAVRSQMHSGFLLDPMNADADFVTDPAWSNWFKLGWPSSTEAAPVVWANVNGWFVPVTGTGVVDGDPANRINLYNPPATDARIDLVFLEVWQAQIAPNPSEANKPSASTVYKYGNTQFGGTNFNDEMKDPTVGYETTERVQIQYRIRTYGSGAGLGDSVDLSQYPDGLDDPTVLAQGASTDPVAGYVWTNMGDQLGDRGLWRSGVGNSQSRTDLGTVDGYAYAIPICAVFRRNSSPFVALTDSGNANQNGALDRNPVSGALTDPLQATRTFTSVALASDLVAASEGVISVTGLAGSGLDNVNINWAAMAVKIDDEIMVLQAVNTASGEIMIASITDTVNPWTGAVLTATAGRGRFGTMDTYHLAGATVEFFNFRPDSLYADGIAPQDILDLRRGVTGGEWSYEDILKHNLGRVLDGTLHSSYKQGSGTDTQGVEIIEVDTYRSKSAGTLPNQTEQLDGFDGIRQVFSDSAVVQNDVSLLLKITGGVPSLSGDSWDVAPDFSVSGFVPAAGAAWVDDTVIEITIGGSDGTTGARETSYTGDRFMRFVSPKEYWLARDEILGIAGGVHGNQKPFLMRFPGDSGSPPTAAPYGWSQPMEPYGSTANAHPGPMFPLQETEFHGPYIVLGGLANTDVPLYDTAAVTLFPGADGASNEVDLLGITLDFDTAGAWYDTVVAEISTTGITNLLLHGERNLFDLLTNGGRDRSGLSSELYITMTDTSNSENNGCFRVVGAGTIGYTWYSATNAHSIVVQRVGATASDLHTGDVVSVSFRTQYMNTQDDLSGTYPAIAIVLTDIGATTADTSNPWAGIVTSPYDGQMVLDTSILYGPSRGATARVADTLSRFTVEAPAGAGYTVLREAPENIDPDSTEFRTRTGVPEDEYYYPMQPVPCWNRLPSLGEHAPVAPDYGDGRYNFETRREAELFVDEGSKSVIFRPFQQMDMCLPLRSATGDQVPPTYDGGSPNVMGGSGLFEQDHIFAVPQEYMPRFGRQDIPIRATAGVNGPYIGINHLFGDSDATADLVRYIVGGNNNTSPVVTDSPLTITTASATGLTYGDWNASDGFQGRLYEDVNARSSDINKPMRGIQFPPFLGAARVYAVYEASDYASFGSCYTDEGFTKRTTGSYATNLLRTDADKQTLFIVKDGANDVLANHDAHTYVVPEEAIDIQLAPAWADGTVFTTFEYVVEVAVFGFDEGFINKNNYVFLRSDANLEYAPDDGLWADVRMILPAAMGGSVRGYSAYTRTVYQGDPYMTRDGATLQTADYEYRYGMVPVSDANMLNTPLQQYTTANDQIPEIPNARSLEVLASVDFWTSLGTGKMGGPVYAGTPTDAAYLFAPGTRLPESGTENPWQPTVRAFTAPQPDAAGFASVSVICNDFTTMVDQVVGFTRGTQVGALQYNAEFGPSTDAEGVAADLAAAINTMDATSGAVLSVWASAVGTECRIYSRVPGEAGSQTVVSLRPATATPTLQTGLKLSSIAPYGTGYSTSGANVTTLSLSGATDLPVNAKESFGAATPLRLTGMTERLPLGILVQDSDFIGEDPLRKGMAYEVISGGGDQSTTAVTTFSASGQENTRLSGPGGQLGMADGAILKYTAYNADTAPDGVKQFRLFRGGGSAYVLSTEDAGGPVDFTSGGFSEGDDPILKGAVLVGRAYLVRNEQEAAFSTNVTRSYGDELQMVVVTNAVYGEGLDCDSGYILDGIISPTDYGKGYAASDRYRLEGKLLVKSRAALLDPDIELAPYPPEDPADDDPCA
jgi:hypothetical protein